MIAVCPSNDELKALSLGELSEEKSDELFRHVHVCESCQARLKSIDDREDTLVHRLRSNANVDDVDGEPGCRIAVAKALAALAEAGTPTSNLTIPKQIGEYDIVKPLGQGGMGHVYLGRHTKLGRSVAIKLIADHRRWDQTMHSRFESEMKLIGSLEHPNIVGAYDAREVDGLAVLVTEFIDGLNVSEILKRQVSLSPAIACRIASEVCKALSYIDSKGMVHRDIKPSNIMIDRKGQVKLLDLGLARLQSTEEEPGHFTATGQAMGTADYVAPEQIEDGRNVDVRADIYGLGCTLYKMLSGRAPFDEAKFNSSFAKMNAHVSETPTPISSLQAELPAELSKLVGQTLEKKPANRPQTPDELLKRLEKHASKANLAALVAATDQLTEPKSNDQKPEPRKPPTKPAHANQPPWWITLVGTLATFAFGIWLGVVVTLKRSDGTHTSVVIPDGSTAIVDAEGNIEIHLAGSDKAATIPSEKVEFRDGHSSTTSEAHTNQHSEPAFETTLTPDHEIRFVDFRIPKNSPLFGNVEKGDSIDIFARGTETERADDNIIRQLIASKVEVLHTSKDSAKLTVSFPITNHLVESVLRQIEPAPTFEFEFHDAARQNMEDRMRLSGAWKIQLQKFNGRATTDVEDLVVVFCRDQLYILSRENVQNVNFDVHPDQIELTANNIQEFVDFRFLSRGRLEVQSKNFKSLKNGPPIELLWRMEKIWAPKTETEQVAFRVLQSGKQAKTKFEMWLAQDDANGKLVSGSTDKVALLGEKPLASNADIISAQHKHSQGPNQELVIQVGQLAQYRINESLRNVTGKKLAIAINGDVVSAPRIIALSNSPQYVISLKQSANEVQRLAREIVPLVEVPRDTLAWRNHARLKTRENLKKLAMAMHNYESLHRRFPTSENRHAADIELEKDAGRAIKEAVGGNEKIPEQVDIPPFSWRVAILPFLGDEALEIYHAYNFSAPWDDESNLKLLDKMPDVFRSPHADPGSTNTNYFGIADKRCLLGKDRGTNFGSVTDGLSNTILLLEANNEIPWTKPEDLHLSAFSDEQLKAWNFPDPGSLNVVIGDGSTVVFDRRKLNQKILESLLMISDGKTVDFDMFRLPDDFIEIK